MRKKNRSFPDMAEIRRLAEEQQSSSVNKTSSPDNEQDLERLLQELQIHQIELRMQNEELQRAQSEIEAGLERYTNLYNFAPMAYFTLDHEGIIRELNLEGAKMLGMSRSSLINRHLGVLVSHDTRSIYNAFLDRVFESHAKETSEIVLMSETGEKIYVQVDAIISGDGSDCHVAAINITERVRAEAERQVVLDMLRLINVPSDLHDIVRPVIEYLMNWAGCEAVRIRMRDGNDYPYYDANGFTGKFIIVENQLCQIDENGDIIHAFDSDPFLEAMCWNILQEIFDPGKPYYTDYGSFWTNDAVSLLASNPEVYTNSSGNSRSNSECYQSIALIPLRSSGEMIGLLQFNDKQKDRFTPEMIALIERLAGNIADALMKNHARQELNESRTLLQSIIASTTDAIYAKDPHGRYTLFNAASEKVFSKCAADVLGNNDSFLFPPDKASAIMESDQRILEMAATTTFEETTKDIAGKCSTYLITKGPLYDENGKPLGLFGIARDISEHVQSEAEKRRFYRDTIKSVTQGKLDLASFDEVSKYVDPSRLISVVVSPEDSRIARNKTMDFCALCGLTDDRLELFESAIGETITNAIKHANGCRVYGGLDDSSIWVAVSDTGQGIPHSLIPSATLRRGFSSKISMGMGYTIMLEATDHLTLCTGSKGTTVVLSVNIEAVNSDLSLDDYPDMWDDVLSYA